MNIVTIIIPSFNSSGSIRECLSEIENAIPELLDAGVVRVLIKDGNSTDGSVEIINHCKEIYPWLDALFIKDKNVYDAMNQAVSFCSSKWVFFLGADDIILSGFAEALPLLATDVKEEKIHYFNVKLVSGAIYDGFFSRLKMIRKNVCHQSIFYPTLLLKKYSYSLKYRSLGDWALNIQLFSYFTYHDYVIAQYNDITGLSKEYRDNEFFKDKPMLVLKSFGRFCYFMALAYKFLGRVKYAMR